MTEKGEKMIKRFCDICGKELKEITMHRYRVQEVRFFSGWVTIEICGDCFKALKDKHIERKDND